MAKFDGKFDSARQEWGTPQKLYDACDQKYNYNFDLAGDKSNSKCNSFFTKQDNSLLVSWTGLGNCWLNPPYGEKGKCSLVNWIQKAKKETEKDSNLLVSLLIPARTNTVWFLDLCINGAYAIDFIIGRPIFSGAKYGLPQPLMLVTFKYNKNNPPIYGFIKV